jgi:hypothetical protein
VTTTFTGDQNAAEHTCRRGPLCDGWRYEEVHDPISYEAGYGEAGPEGCDHRSCNELVNEDCLACQAEAWATYEAESRCSGDPPCDADCPPGTHARWCAASKEGGEALAT